MGKKTASTQGKHDDPSTKESFILLQVLATIISYTEMLKIMPDISFHQGMPNDLVQSKYFDPNIPSLIVYDDSMRTVMNDDMAADLFRDDAHHRNTCVVFYHTKLIFSRQAK